MDGASKSPARMRFLILEADYPEFLRSLYATHPGLETRPHAEQMQVRRTSLFGQSSFYSENLKELNHEAYDVYPNNELMQAAWAKEHGVAVRAWNFRLRRSIVPWISRAGQYHRMCDILAAQIKHYKPDVIFNQMMNGLSTRFLREIKHHCRLLVGKHAATRLSDTEDWTVYDLVVSSFPPTVEWFRERRVRAQLHRIGFEPSVLSQLIDSEQKIPASFVGSFHPVHRTRVQWLEHICAVSQVQVWSAEPTDLPLASSIRRSYVSQAWGRDMFQVLRNSLVTLNHHGEIPPFANNLRLFEATGVGTLLITDWKENLKEMFEPGKEVVTYRTSEECAELIRYYLQHDDERREIACAGQQRTLRDHTYTQRVQEFVGMVEAGLAARSAVTGQIGFSSESPRRLQ
jgi:spore maturation protein CgeB